VVGYLGGFRGCGVFGGGGCIERQFTVRGCGVFTVGVCRALRDGVFKVFKVFRLGVFKIVRIFRVGILTVLEF
jgi:hypothetical protein